MALPFSQKKRRKNSQSHIANDLDHKEPERVFSSLTTPQCSTWKAPICLLEKDQVRAQRRVGQPIADLAFWFWDTLSTIETKSVLLHMVAPCVVLMYEQWQKIYRCRVGRNREKEHPDDLLSSVLLHSKKLHIFGGQKDALPHYQVIDKILVYRRYLSIQNCNGGKSTGNEDMCAMNVALFMYQFVNGTSAREGMTGTKHDLVLW
jgi:hypothetical protein